jgi:hypothetical protein
VTKNSKSQISNNKWFDKLTTLSLVEGQNTMTEIVRASLGLPTLRAGPQFRNPKPLHHLKIRELQTCFGHWILEFVIYLIFGAWSLEFHRLAS